MSKTRIMMAIAATSLTAAANADIISFTVTVPAQATNWSQVVQVPQFDPALGTLTSVNLQARIDVETQMRFENLGATSSTYDGTVNYAASLLRPDNTVLVAIADSAVRSGNLAQYDLITDFSGPSGTMVNVAIAPAQSADTESVADLAAFTGVGTIGLPASATANSTLAMGSGRAVMGVSTLAGLEVTVRYDFIPIPAPAGFAAMGLAGAALLRRRR